MIDRRRMVKLMSQKMGIHEWSYDNDISLALRQKVPHVPNEIALKDVRKEVELGFDRARLEGGDALPQLRCRDRVRPQAVHRM